MTRRKILLTYDAPGWAHHLRCLALEKHAPANFDVQIRQANPACCPAEEPDLVLQLVPPHLKEYSRIISDRGWRTLLVGAMNVGFGHHEDRWAWCTASADHTIINNRDLWERLQRPHKATWISNGVDRDLFRVTVPLEDRPHKVLWTGSVFHSGQATDIKGYLSHLLPLGERLAAAGIPFDWHRCDSVHDRAGRKWSSSRMVEWYNTGTIYVCASQSEGTPNPALEAAACGCTIVSTRVGNMPELIRNGENGWILERTVGWLYDGIRWAMSAWPLIGQQMQRDIAQWDWRLRAPLYFDLFERLIRERDG